LLNINKRQILRGSGYSA